MTREKRTPLPDVDRDLYAAVGTYWTRRYPHLRTGWRVIVRRSTERTTA